MREPTFEQASILDHQEIKDFIERREFRAEHFPLLLELGTLPADLFHIHHNFFGFAKEKVIEQLKREIQTHPDKPQWIRYCEIFIKIAEAYGWPTAWNTNVVFEKLLSERK